MIKRHPLIAFFVLSFAITWSIGAVVLVFGDTLVAQFGDLDLRRPFWKSIFHLATYSPAISALIVIRIWRGPNAIGAYIRRVFQFRAAPVWYAAVFIGYPLVQWLTVAIANALHPDAAVAFYQIQPWYLIVPLLLVHLFDNPGGVEELGWRGFALPLLQQRMNALNASLLLGFIWGVWHIPAFYITGMSQSGVSLPVFILSTTALSVLMTAIYNGSGGNIPLLFCLHSLSNFNYGRAGDPPNERLWQLIVMAGIAVVLIAVRGRTALAPAKWTHVVPDDPPA